MPTLETQEPTEGEGSTGRNMNCNRDRKHKEEQDSKLVAAVDKAGQAGTKKQRWGNKPRRPAHNYEEIMSGQCQYHSRGTYKANHSTRECQHNDQLTKEKNDKNIKGDNTEDAQSPSPPARAGSQARGSGGGGQKAFPKEVTRVNMIFRGRKSKCAQKQAHREVYALVP